MRIGINALYLLPGKVGGTEVYLRRLLEWMPRLAPQHEYVVFLNKESEDAALAGKAAEQDVSGGSPLATVRMIKTGVGAISRPRRLLYEQFRLPALVRDQRLDVLFNPGFTASVRCPCPMVTTFHDLQHKRHPEYFKAADLAAWNFFLAAAARTSKRILAVSEASAQDFRRYYPGVAAPIDVTPLGAGESYFAIGDRRRASAVEQAEDVLLCVSTLHPHKNLDRLVRAFATWRKQSSANTQLVIAGMRGFFAERLEETMRDCGATSFVRLTGWISDEELQRLYTKARAFIFPSLFEGFGIPVVEALASGLATAVSDIEPMRSHAGDAALCFDPRDEESIVEAIERILQDEPLRAELCSKAQKRAELFRWEGTARLTLASLEAAGRRV